MIPNNQFWFNNKNANTQIVDGSILTTGATTYMVSDASSLLNDQIKGTTQKFSIVARVKRTWADQTYQTIFSRDNNAGGRQFACEWDEEERITFFIADNAGKYSWWKSVDSFVRTNSFYTFGFTFDNTLALANKCKIYVDGVEVSTTRVDVGAGVSDVNNQPAEPIYIGVTNYGGFVNPVRGYISSVSFYTDILTAADNLAIYNGGSAYDERSGLSISPYMYWNFGNSVVGGNITTDDIIGTSYPVSKQFTSSGAVTVSLLEYPIPLVYNAATNTLIAAMVDNPSVTRKDLIDDFIVACISDGNWAELELIKWYASHGANDALLNWISPASNASTLINAPVFTTDEGFIGNSAASRYIDENFNTANGVKYTLNSGSLFAFNRLNINAAEVSIGNADGADLTIIVPLSTGSCSARINSATNTSFIHGDSTGMFAVIRTASNVQKVYMRGVEAASSAAVSTARPNLDLFTLAYNNGGVAGLVSNNRISFTAVGSGSVDQSKLNRRVINFLIGMGTNI